MFDGRKDMIMSRSPSNEIDSLLGLNSSETCKEEQHRVSDDPSVPITEPQLTMKFTQNQPRRALKVDIVLKSIACL